MRRSGCRLLAGVARSAQYVLYDSRKAAPVALIDGQPPEPASLAQCCLKTLQAGQNRAVLGRRLREKGPGQRAALKLARSLAEFAGHDAHRWMRKTLSKL